MDRIDQIKNVIDEAIISSDKKYLPLRTANKLLWDKRIISEFERDEGYLKSLLEKNKLNAIQTEYQPRQWRIYPSNYVMDSINNLEDSNDKKEPTSNKKVDLYLILGVLSVFAVLFFGVLQQNSPGNGDSFENESVEQESVTVESKPKENKSTSPQPVTNTQNTKSTSPASKNVHTLKSTLHDKERNGKILHTSREVMYHTIDLNKLTVTHSFQVDGIWKEIVYPFSEYYTESGMLHTTMVLKVGVKGVKEIWWTPEVNNLGYDFFDGNRLVSYDLERVTQ